MNYLNRIGNAAFAFDSPNQIELSTLTGHRSVISESLSAIFGLVQVDNESTSYPIKCESITDEIHS